jgi:hypothetical protein
MLARSKPPALYELIFDPAERVTVPRHRDDVSPSRQINELRIKQIILLNGRLCEGHIYIQGCSRHFQFVFGLIV